MRRGLLLTMTEPPPAMEEEFNAWYDSEHLPERLAIPGFRSARRWVAAVAPGEGKYLATYELDSPQVLDSPDYLGHVGDGFTPWSKRCLGRAVVFRRWACQQIEPGEVDPDPSAAAMVLVASEDETATRLIEAPGVLNARRFVAHSGAPRFITLYELALNEAPRALKPAGESLLRVYRAYRAAG